jgi:hypothetical protein
MFVPVDLVRAVSAARLLLRFVVVVAALGLTAGCPDLDLRNQVPDAVIACTSDDDCPAGLICGAASGLCVAEGGVDDKDAPVATLIAVDPAVLSPGAAVRVTFEVNEDLAAAPAVSVDVAGVDIDIVEGDHRAGDRQFVAAFSVPTAAPASVTVTVGLVDRFNNAGEQVFGPFDVDGDGPDLSRITASVGDKAKATNGDTLTVTVELDDGDVIVGGDVVTADDGTVIAALAVADGAFVPLVLQGLPDGEDLVVEVTGSDAVGTTAVGRSNVIPIDTLPPAFDRTDIVLSATNGDVIAGDIVPQSFRVRVDADDGDDVDTVCVRAVVAANIGGGACDDDDDFSPAGDVVAVSAAFARGALALEVVARDEAQNTTVVAVPLVVLEGPAAATTMTPPATQTAVKVGDSISIDGTTIEGATVTVTLVDSVSGVAVASPREVVADGAGAFSTLETVPQTVANGTRLKATVVPRVLVGTTTIPLPGVDADNDLVVDLVPPTVALSTPSTTVITEAVEVDFDITGASSAVVSGDIVSADPIAPIGGLDEDGTVVGTINVELTPGDGLKAVIVTVVDGAGNSASATLLFTLDSSIPAVALLMRNAGRAVPGVGPQSSIDFSGVTSESTVVSRRLLFFDDVGDEVAACEQQVPFVLTPNGSGFDISVATPILVGPCPGASRVGAELIVENAAGQRSVAALSLGRLDVDNNGVADAPGSDFYFDDTAPVVQPVVVDFDRSAPPGRDAIPEVRGADTVVVTPTRDITVVLEATDENPMVASVGGVSPVVSASVALVTDVPSAPQAFTINGTDGDKTITLLVQDEVGNTAPQLNTTVVLDTAAPALPLISATVYREVPADDVGDVGDDDLSDFVVAGVASAVEDNARVFAFAPDDDAANDVAIASAAADANGSYADIDVGALGAPVVDVDVVAVDSAGNRSPPLRITRPRFGLSASVAVMGPTPASVQVSVVDPAALDAAGISADARNVVGTVPTVDAGDIVVTPDGADFDVAFALDADDGVVEGTDTLVGLVDGRGPNLHPTSSSVDGILLSVDFTPPQVALAQLRVSELVAQTDTLVGLAGAVSDLAGADVRGVAGLAVRVTGGGLNVTVAAAADGSFGPVSLGADRPDTMEVVVVSDAAGNAGNAVALNAPVFSNLLLSANSAKAGDVITGTVEVDNMPGLGDAFSVSLGTVSGTIDGVDAVAGTTTVSFSITIGASAQGLQDLQASATSQLGLSAAFVQDDAVFLDLTPPTITLTQPLAAVTNDAVVTATVVENRGEAVTTFSLQDDQGKFFDGAAFTADLEVLLPNEGSATNVERDFGGAVVSGDVYTGRIESTDGVGNVATVSFSFTFDNTPPSLVFTTAPANGTSTVVPYVAESDDPAAQLLCSLPGGSEIPCAFTGPVHVPFGAASQVRFTAVDDVGNRSATQTFTIALTPKIQVAQSGGTVCAVRDDDDALFCWGDNRDGHLGDPDVGGAPFGFITPTRVFAGEQWQNVAVGGDVVCGDTAGGFKCFGSKRKGLFPGDDVGVNETITTPIAIAGLSATGGIAMNETRGCALDGTGTLLCWGEPVVARDPGDIFESFAVGVASGTVGVGDDHVCVLAAAAGEVRCVGRNTHGQLGTGVAIGAVTAVPVVVAGFPGAPATLDQLEVADARTCVRVTGAGPAICVGENGGAIQSLPFDLLSGPGDPNIDATATPQIVDELSDEAIFISTGGARTCALDRQGAVSCVGTSAFAATGDGGGVDTVARGRRGFGAPGDVFDTVLAFARTTCAVRAVDGALLCAGDTGHAEISAAAGRLTPSAVPFGGAASALSVTTQTLCATVDGARTCTGDSSTNTVLAGAVEGEVCTVSCEVGSECVQDRCVGSLSLPMGDVPVAFAAAGVSDAFASANDGGCVVQGGEVRCAGRSTSRLGRGATFNNQQTAPERTPTLAAVATLDVSVGVPPPLLAVDARLSVGDDTACVIGDLDDSDAVSILDGLSCWGEHTPSGPSDIALLFDGLGEVQEVAVGRAHGCVLRQPPLAAPLEVSCFGDDDLGARGDDGAGGTFSTVVTSTAPVVPRASPGGDHRALSALGATTCVLRDGDGVACWGDNRSGIVSPQNTTLSSSTVAIEQTAAPFDAVFDVVAVGRDSACAGRDDTLVCWGRPITPLDGADDPGDDGPVVISATGVRWLSLFVGDGFVCGLTDVGTVQCVGAGTAGVFGDGSGLIEVPTEVVLP